MITHNGQAVKKTIAAAFTIGMIGLVGTGTASATHTHSMEAGNGSCVLLARNGGEDNVTLPFASGGGTARLPNWTNSPLSPRSNRR